MVYRDFEITEISKKKNLYHIEVENIDKGAFKRGLIIVSDSISDIEDVVEAEVDYFLDHEED